MKKNAVMLPVMNNLRVKSHLDDAPTILWGFKKIFVVLMLCMGLFVSKSFAAPPPVYYNVANSDVSNVNNWGTSSDGSGTHPTNFTTSGTFFYLYNGTTNTVGAAVAFASSSSSAPVTLVIGNGTTAASLTVNATFTLTVGSGSIGTSGALTVATGSTLTALGTLAANAGDGPSSIQINGTLIASGATGSVTGFTATNSTVNGTYQHDINGGTVPTSTWSTNSICYITGSAATAPGGMSQDFYHITWNCTGQTGNMAMNWATGRHIRGNITVQATGATSGSIFQLRLVALSGASNYSFTIDGNISVSGNSFLTTTGSGTGTGTVSISIGGNVSIGSGSTLSLNGGGNTETVGYSINGNFSNAGTLTSSGIAQNNTLTFAGSNVQTYSNTGTITATLTGTKIAVSTGATLDVGSSTIPSNIPFTLNSNATLQTANAGGVNGSILAASPTLSATANYSFNGSGAQNTGALLTSAGNLSINNSAGVTLSGATNVSGILYLTNGALSQSTFALTLGNSASITRSNGTISTTPTFGTTVNVTYAQNGSSITTGAELPTSTSVLNNLNINSTNGVALNAPATVNGILSLTGNLTIGNNNLTLNAVNAVAGTPSISNHIVTSGTGVVTTTAAFSSLYTFPVGFDGGDYNPVNITPNSETPSVLVKSIAPTLSSDVSSRAMWTIGGLTSSSTILAFPWNSATDITGSLQAGMILYSLSGGTWSSISTSATTGTYKTSLTGNISGTTTYGIGPNATPSLGLSSSTGTDVQSTNTSTAITTITYSWGGAATGATVTWKDGSNNSISTPSGLTVTTSGSVSISGTVASAGTYNYTVTTVGGSPAATATGTLTIAATPAATLAVNGAVGAGNVYSGFAGIALVNFSVAVANENTSVTGFNLPITVGGGLVASDLVNYKLYYTSGSSFTSPTLLATVASSLATTPINFASFSQAINSGSTGYFWVTVDIAAAATSTHNIAAAAFDQSNLTFSNTVTKSGSVAASGAQTVIYPTYYNVLNSDISNLNKWGMNSDGTGTHPTNFTNANVTYNLNNGTSNSISSSVAISGLGSLLNIGTSAGLTVTSPNTLTIGTSASYNVANNTSLVVPNGASLTINGTLSNYGALTDSTTAAKFVVNGTYEVGGNPTNIPTAIVPYAATWNSSSTLLISGATTASPANFSPTTLPFYNVTWNSPNQNGAIAYNWSGKILLGNLTIANTNNQVVRLYGISSGVTSSTTINGNFAINAATAQLSVSGSSSTGVAIVNILGDFNISAGIFYFNTGGTGQSTPTTISVAGNINATGGTITAGATGLGLVNTFTLQGNTSHNYTNSSTTGAFTNVNVTVPTGEVLNIASNTIASPYKFNLNTGATLQTTSVTGIDGNLTTTGAKTLNPAANYIFNGSSAQSTGTLLATANNITVNNSAGVTVNSAATINGTLALTSGVLNPNTLLTLGNGATVAITGGSLSSAPTFGTSVNVTYNQNGTSTITGVEIPTNASILNNLTINTSNGVVLGSNVAVNGTLTLTSGQLTLGSNNLALAASYAVAGTPSASKHIITDGSGYVTNTSANSSQYTFPVGYSASAYNPVVITPSSETPTVKVATITPALTNSLKAMWIIGGVTSTSSVISFPWISGVDNAQIAQKAGMVYSYNGSSWGTALDNSSTTGSIPSYTTSINTTAFASPSIFTVGPPSAATLALTSAMGTDGQSLNTTTAISDITYEFSGSASTATVSWTGTSSSSVAPTGISVNLDQVLNTVTISGTASSVGNYGYTVMTDGSPAASKIGSITVAATANVVIATSTSVTLGNIFPGSADNQLTNFSVRASGNSATLTTVQMPISASVGFTAAELVDYKLYYTTTNTFSNSTLLATVNSGLVTSPITFTSFSKTITSGSTGYFWITADVSNSATLGHTITANSIVSSNLTFALNANVTGTIATQGTQTITYPTYYNVSNSDISLLNSWGDNTDGTGMHPSNFAGAHTTYNLVNGSANRLGTSTSFSGSGTILVIGDSVHATSLTVSTTTLTVGTATASTGSLVISPKGTLIVGTAAYCTILAGGSINVSNATATLSVNGYLKNSGSFSVLNNGVYGVFNVSGTGSTYEHNINGGTIPLATWGTGSTLLINGMTSTAPTFSGTSFNNVTWNCAGQTTFVGPIFNSTSINGNLIISSTGNSYLRFFGMTSGAPNNLTVGGNLSISGSTVYTNGSGSKGYAILTLGGNFSVASGSSFFFNNGSGHSSCTINMLSGNFSNAGVLTTNAPTTDSVAIVFKKAGSQTFTNTATNGTATGIVSTLANTIVSVNSGTNLSVVSDTLPGLNINSGASITLASKLVVKNTFINNSSIAGTIVLGGTLAQVISGSGSITNLTLNNAAGATIAAGSNLQNITGLLTLQSGHLTTNGNITLKSTSITNTAVVAPVTGSISGNVTVERFIPKGLRVYRDLGAGGIANAGNIFTNWQEGGVNNNGYGSQITGSIGASGGYDNASGFDYSPYGGASLFTYKNQTWDSVTYANGGGTKGTTLDPFQGFRLLIRGNRTNTLAVTQPLAMSSNVTLRTTGKLVTGNVTFNVGSVTSDSSYTSSYGLVSASNGFSLISNPYASTVDWDAVIAQSNMNGTYWYNDPTFTIGGNGSSFVGYTVFVAYNNQSGINNIYNSANSISNSKLGQYLQPGQAVFVQNPSSGTAHLNFTETSKSIQTRTAIFGTDAALNRIAVGLFKNGSNLDGAVSVFKGSFSQAFGNEDAIKFPNATENITFNVAGKNLAINGYTLPTASDVLSVHMTNLVINTAYTIKLDASQFNGNGLQAYIKDNVLNTTTLLSGSNNAVSFTTTSVDIASYANRYSIVFGAGLLPVTDIKLTATAQVNGVQVAWTTVGELNVANYTVQHSVDGVTFTDMATVAADNNANTAYSLTDSKTFVGTNYYRIKVSSNDGTVSYSNIATVSVSKAAPSIAAYPNPLVGNTLKVALNNLEAGKYNLAIYDVLGVKVIEKSITHVGGTAVEQLSINRLMAAGAYSIRVSNANGVSYQSQIEVK